MDDNLNERKGDHSEISWSEITRQATREIIETLEVMDKFASESELTESDVQEIADKSDTSVDASALTRNWRRTNESGH